MISFIKRQAQSLIAFTLLLIAVPGILVSGYWFFGGAAQREVVELERKLEEQRRTFESEMNRLLGEQRRAQFIILDQEERDGERWNTVKFLEFFRAGEEETAFEQTFELPGREIYIDSLAVKFHPDEVRAGRAHNFSVFRRAFSNKVRPDDGVELYDKTLREAQRLAGDAVAMERPSDAEIYLQLLLGYLRDEKKAQADGVKLIEGQANYVNPRPGFYYELIQNAGGDLDIVEREIPAILRGDGQTTPSSRSESGSPVLFGDGLSD